MKLAIAFDRLRWEEKELMGAASRASVECQMVDVKTVSSDVTGQGTGLVCDVVLQRCISHYRSLMSTMLLEGEGKVVINSLRVSETCGNKLATTIALSGAGVPTPRTVASMSSETALRAAETLGFPVVLKPFVGSWGRMVVPVRDRETLESSVEYRDELPNPMEQMYYIQKMVDRPPRDIRAIVAGDELVACVYRNAAPGQWRTNVARGGSTEPLRPTPELSELILKAARAVGGGILGIDAMESDGGYVVHEVNGTVEFRGAQSAVETDIAERLIRYVAGFQRR